MKIKKAFNNLILNILAKFITVENVSSLVARLIVRLMEYARKKGDVAWDKTKAIVCEINRYTSLFMQVYEDDTLTEEEEEEIRKAILAGGNEEKLSDILERLKGTKR